ncbi:MAG: UPF0164 family protein [Candidatus Zixiibacteriota bacterium]|nr:MAG: UPF0164 family protein [candidate division Zixibacteria bacterium]
MRFAVTTAISLCLIMSVMHGPSFAGDAGQESPFSIGSGVRALSMGGGLVAMADDASKFYCNQAGLALLERK